MNTILVALFLVSAALVAGQDTSTTTTTTTVSPNVPCGTKLCDTAKTACLNRRCVANQAITLCQDAGSGTVTSVSRVKGNQCQIMCYGETANMTINADGKQCKLRGRDERHHHDGHHDKDHHQGKCRHGVCTPRRN